MGEPASGHRTPEGLVPADRGPLRPLPGRARQPASHRAPVQHPTPYPAWWPRLRRGLSSLGVALLLVVFGSALLYWRGPALAPAASELVVWRAPGQEATTLSAVDRAEWESFLASRREARVRIREAILVRSRAEMKTALAPLFDDMKDRIKDYIGWFYFFPTTYRMAFTSVFAVLLKDADDSRAMEQVATDSLNRLLQDRFLEVVVVKEKFAPAVEARARAVQKQAVERAQAAAAEEVAFLATFMAEHGKPAPAGQTAAAQPVVVSWEAMSLPAPASAMSAPPDAAALIKVDPALSGMQTTAPTEGMMLIARQIARRMVQIVAADTAGSTLLPMVAGSGLALETMASPAIGFAAFVIGVGAEFGTVKLREIVESRRLEELSAGIVDRLQENQSNVLAEGVTRHIETWLGGERAGSGAGAPSSRAMLRQRQAPPDCPLSYAD